MQITSSQVSWSPSIAYENATLRIATPDGKVIERSFVPGMLSISVADLQQDGLYSWELLLSPVLHANARKAMLAERNEGTIERLRKLHREVDEAAQQAAQSYHDRLRCHRGCCDCCVDELTVFEIEGELIRLAHGDLLAQQHPHPMTPIVARKSRACKRCVWLRVAATVNAPG